MSASRLEAGPPATCGILPRFVLAVRGSQLARCVPMLGVLAAAGLGAQERIGKTSTRLTATTSTATTWIANGNNVPVCWETAGFDREKAIVRAAVIGTWEFYSTLRFVGWDVCPTSGSAKHVRIRVTAQDATNGGAGGSAAVGMAALSSAAENNPHVHLSFKPDGTADRGRVEYVGVHEFGHVIGFIHEQDAPGNVEGPAHCRLTFGVNPDAQPLTDYDRDSIMNYCNRDGNMTGNLTDADIAGVQAVYGIRRPNKESLNSCASSMVGGPASLAAVWDDAGLMSIAVFPSNRSSFLYHAQWSVRDGGWGESIKWMAGDFDGDGRSDIAAAWDNGGTNTLTVRRSTGTSFSPVHWAINVGGWMPSTVWLPGDFNGDGRSDIAGIWDDAGRTSIAVFLSDGARFLYPSQWSLRDGGWGGGESIKWTAGDFNGDGRTDIAAAWNNGGRITLTVRQSTGSGFSPVHWAIDAGAWTKAAVFIAGDFNKDGRADLARLWNDLSSNSIAVSLSAGRSFSGPVDWSLRDGGWAAVVKWVAGDFNGDGLTDIGAAWNNGGTNTLTIRQSTGAAFHPAHWAVNAGGWMDTTAWCSGAFR